MGKKRKHPLVWIEEKKRLEETIRELRERIYELEAQLELRKSVRKSRKSRKSRLRRFLEGMRKR